MAKKSKFLEIIEFIPLRIVLSIIKLLPRKVAIRFGSKFVQILFLVFNIGKKVSYKNLDFLCANRYSKNDKAKIYKEMSRNLGKVLFSLMYFDRISNSEFISDINVNTSKTFEKEIEKKAGLIGVTMHFGNWEVLGSAITHYYNRDDFYTIVRPLDNKLLNKYIEKYRTRFGLKLVSKFDSPRKMVRLIQDGNMLALLADQNSLKGGVFIPFGNRMASASAGPATFHLLTEANVFVGYSYFEKTKYNDLTTYFTEIMDFQKEFDKLSDNKKGILFLFNRRFNLEDESVDLEIFNGLIDMDNYIYYDELDFQKTLKISDYINDIPSNFSNLTKREKIFFITYFIHQHYYDAIIKSPENWMLVHPKWKKQPKNFKYLYR